MNLRIGNIRLNAHRWLGGRVLHGDGRPADTPFLQLGWMPIDHGFPSEDRSGRVLRASCRTGSLRIQFGGKR